MGLYGQRLVQDKNLNPPDDRKYVILVRLRGGKGHNDTRAESKPKHAVRAGQCRAEFLSNTPPLADENMKQPEALAGSHLLTDFNECERPNGPKPASGFRCQPSRRMFSCGIRADSHRHRQGYPARRVYGSV